jgi:AAHS family 4-hydroxybenzoate transporter-like MFS transporter
MTITTIDVADFIDRRPVSAFQIRIFASCLAVALLDGLDLQTMGLAAPTLMREWKVPAEAFATVFSAAPAGMIVGALVLGRLADQLGRKRLIVVATLLFGGCTMLTPFASTLGQLAVLRFVTGLGLGGVLPNLTSLVTEFAPGRLRGRLTTLAFSGLPFGSMVAGLLAAWLIPSYGWPSLFYVGGLLPIAIGIVAMIGLPESIRFLVLRGDGSRQAVRILRELAPDDSIPDDTRLTLPESSGAPVSFARLLGPGRTATTVLLALVVALNLFMLYLMLNWLPTLMRNAGLSNERALLATVVINTGGGVGAIMWGMLVDRFGGLPVMSVAGVAAFVALTVLGLGHRAPAVLVGGLFVAGGCIMGGMPGLYAVIGSVFPTTIRSTGAGVVLGVGRIGSVLGPAAGGVLLSLGWSVPAILVVVGLPGLVWAAAMWWMRRLPRDFR